MVDNLVKIAKLIGMTIFRGLQKGNRSESFGNTEETRKVEGASLCDPLDVSVMDTERQERIRTPRAEKAGSLSP